MMPGKREILTNVEVEDATAEHGVLISTSIGPIGIEIEIPSWAAGMVVSKVRPAIEDAAEEYHDLLDEIEEAAL